MPTYSYVCEGCGHGFEKFHSMSDDPVKKCPNCGKMKVKRLIGGGAGLIFRGSGFYTTDYKNKSTTSDSNGDSGVKKSSKKEGNGSTETGSGSSTDKSD